MFRKVKESYSNRMFLIFLSFGFVLLAVLCVIQSVTLYGSFQSNLHSQEKIAVEGMNSALSTKMFDYWEAVNHLCEEEAVQRYLRGKIDEDAKIEVLKRLYAIKNGFSQQIDVNVAELKHNSWVSTGDYEGFSSPEVYSNWGVFRKANHSQSVAIYAFSRDAFLKQQDRICLAKAYRDENQNILGYVLLEVSRGVIDTIVKEYNSVYNKNCFLMNKNGSVIYHSSGTEWEGVGKHRDYGDMTELAENASGGLIWEQYTCAYNNFAEVYIIKELPANAMSALNKTLMKTMGVCVLLLLIFGSIFSRIVANSVAYPIEELRETMAKLEQGDLSSRVRVTRQDEIGHLGDSFNAMADKIETLIENIDEKKHSLWISETRSLNLQMNPHFLYNTLDLIKWNAKLGRVQEISDITVQLGKLLRKVMNTKDDLVPVSYEMDIVSSFIELQKKRHGNKLQFLPMVQEDVWNQLIPKLTLEPIVENAVVHAFADKTDECRICVDIRTEGSYLLLTVQDNGEGMDEKELNSALEFRQENTHHIGLSNVQRRAKLYGDDTCGLTITSEPGVGTKVVLRLKQRGQTDDQGSTG